MLEYQGERTDADVFNIVTQQARIGVRNNQADNQDREHIEQQDSPEHLTYRAWNVFRRIFGLACSNTDQLGSLEREADNHSYADHRRKTTSKRRFADCPVAPARRLRAFEDTDNHQHANDDKDNNCRDFDQ